MMWIWIIAAVVLSLLPLINKKIDLSSYIWILLPLDAYGLSIAGSVVKPYMIFAVILPIVYYAKNKTRSVDLGASKGQLIAGIITVLILTQSIFNGDNFAAVKGSIMLLIVYGCAQLYVSCTDGSKSEQLSDVFIASCFGCGIVYIVAHILLQSGIELYGIVTTERAADGMFMKMRTVNNGSFTEAYRLRGFSYDPNTMFVQFIFGISACISKLFKKFNLYHVITIVISVFCVILSSSRMGIICCAASAFLAMVVGIAQLPNVKKKILSIISILFGLTSTLGVLMSRWGQSMLSSLLSTYQNRSSLNDEYGRFSIWKECMSVYWNKNPLWGVGLGNMDALTTTERMTHNTWLQFICECGFIVGGIVIIYFITVLIIGWVNTKQKHINEPDNTAYLCTIIGYTVTIISLSSADNITCSYLWFGALLVLKLAFYQKFDDDTPHNALESHTVS